MMKTVPWIASSAATRGTEDGGAVRAAQSDPGGQQVAVLVLTTLLVQQH